MAICRFQYAAKVVCGEFLEQGEALAPGIYRTEVNVYNPNDRPVHLRKWLLVTIPPGKQQEVESYPEIAHSLKPRHAFAVDCQHLHSLIPQPPPPPPRFVGFFVIESTESLDVTAVYTTAGIREPTAPGIAIEQIKERRIVMEERIEQ